MNRKRKILAVFAVIIFCTGLYFSDKSLKEDKNFSQNDNEEDLILYISSDKNLYSNLTTEIIINVTLHNPNLESIYVSKLFLSKGLMDIYIKDEFDRNLTSGLMMFNIAYIYRKELKSNHSFSYEYNLLDYTPLNDFKAQKSYEFPQNGSYTMYMVYNSILKSNTIKYDII